MTALRCSVWTSHQHVSMDYRLSLIERDVAAHPHHFVLTIDGNLLVHFALGIEPAQRCSIQCSNSGEVRTRNMILLSKLQESGKSLVSLVEDDRILFRRFSRVQQLNLHLGRFAPGSGFRRADIIAVLLLRIPHQAGYPNQYQYATQSCYFDHSFALLSSDSVPSDRSPSTGANRIPPFVGILQMSPLLHLENHGGEVLFDSLRRLCRINLKSRSCCGHLGAECSREVENQPEILVHEP